MEEGEEREGGGGGGGRRGRGGGEGGGGGREERKRGRVGRGLNTPYSQLVHSDVGGWCCQYLDSGILLRQDSLRHIMWVESYGREREGERERGRERESCIILHQCHNIVAAQLPVAQNRL